MSAELPRAPTSPPPTATPAEWAEYYEKHQRSTLLTDLVCTHMVHGPCGDEHPGAPCMHDGACKKQYPRPFVDETVLGDEANIYPTYRRRAPQQVRVALCDEPVAMSPLTKRATKACAQRTACALPSLPAQGGATASHKGRVIDNRWIVPYSPYLLLKYQCHINVECCLSVRGVKYLYKYVHKGPDRAMVALHTAGDALNEIALYRDMRSMGSAEGCWRTFNFAMYSRSPPVHALCIHLANGQRVCFVEGAERAALEAGPPTTELLAWFQCVRDLAPADRRPQLDSQGGIIWAATYPSWPERFKYANKRWTVRARTTNVANIGRVHNVHPSAGEVFYLRLLLHHVPACDLAIDSTRVCPITQEVMQDPVVTSDGHTYERTAIERWFETHSTSPVTNLLLADTHLSADGCAHQVHGPVGNADAFTFEVRAHPWFCAKRTYACDNKRMRAYMRASVRGAMYRRSSTATVKSTRRTKRARWRVTFCKTTASGTLPSTMRATTPHPSRFARCTCTSSNGTSRRRPPRSLKTSGGRWAKTLNTKCGKRVWCVRPEYSVAIRTSEVCPCALLLRAWLHRTQAISDDGLRSRVLLDLEEQLESNGRSLSELCQLELTDAQRASAQHLAQQVAHAHEPRAIRDELTPLDERVALQAKADAAVRKLRTDQKAVFDAVLSALAAPPSVHTVATGPSAGHGRASKPTPACVPALRTFVRAFVRTACAQHARTGWLLLRVSHDRLRRDETQSAWLVDAARCVCCTTSLRDKVRSSSIVVRSTVLGRSCTESSARPCCQVHSVTQ